MKYKMLIEKSYGLIETANHFCCIDMIVDHAKSALTEKFIKELHQILKSGTSDSRKDWFAVGDYKKMPNEIGGVETVLAEEVADKVKALLTEYNSKKQKTLDYRGLKEWDNEKGYLTDTCLTVQDKYKAYLDYLE